MQTPDRAIGDRVIVLSEGQEDRAIGPSCYRFNLGNFRLCDCALSALNIRPFIRFEVDARGTPNTHEEIRNSNGKTVSFIAPMAGAPALLAGEGGSFHSILLRCLLVGVTDAVDDGCSREDGDDPENRCHAVEKRTDDDQHDSLRAFHEADFT